VDFFTVPTVLFHVLFVFVVLAHDRRRILSINVTSNPSAVWTANQIVRAFPWESAPRAPWQSPCVERVIGTVRRELVDHTIVMNERHLRRLLCRYVSEYYHPCRTHLSLGKDAPESRAVEPPESGEVVELPVMGGLHHRTRGERRRGWATGRG